MGKIGVKLNNPLISICILHYNRFDELINTINKIRVSSYSHYEIIVIDNHSDFNGHNKLKELNDNIISRRLPSNKGVSAWNEAFKIAQGEIILVLDDDSYPDINSIELAVRYFEQNENVDIIAANIFNTSMNDYETKNFNPKPDFFVGCGAFIKKEVFNKVGYFNKLIFIYLHELDFCARCYNANLNIVYLKDIIIYHAQNQIRETWKNSNPYKSSFRFYHYFISYSIFLLQRFNLTFILLYLPKWIINRIIVAVRFKYFREFFRALYFLLKNFLRITKNRSALKLKVQKFYRNGNIPFLDHDFLKKNEN